MRTTLGLLIVGLLGMASAADAQNGQRSGFSAPEGWARQETPEGTNLRSPEPPHVGISVSRPFATEHCASEARRRGETLARNFTGARTQVGSREGFEIVQIHLPDQSAIALTVWCDAAPSAVQVIGHFPPTNDDGAVEKALHDYLGVLRSLRGPSGEAQEPAATARDRAERKPWETENLPPGFTMGPKGAVTDPVQLRGIMVGEWRFSRTLHRLWVSSWEVSGIFHFKPDGTYSSTMGRSGDDSVSEAGRYEIVREGTGLPTLTLIASQTTGSRRYIEALDDANLVAVSRKKLSLGVSSDTEATLYPCSGCASNYTVLRRHQ